jgi:small subunit ribosomal protein S6
MFVFDSAATPEWDAVETEIKRIMDRAGARIILSKRWDERKLAYEIRGRRRGLYALIYFEADPAKLVDMARDVELSEVILRHLVVQADHLTEQEMREAADRSAEQLEEDVEPRGGGRYRGRDGDRDRDRDRGSYGDRPPRGEGSFRRNEGHDRPRPPRRDREQPVEATDSQSSED